MDQDSFALFLGTAIIIVLVCVGGPLLLAWQHMRTRAARRMSADDLALIARIGDIAERMERRMGAVEQILDMDSPNWRSQADFKTSSTTGGNYGRKIG